MKWTLESERCDFLPVPPLTCCVTLDLLFNCSKYQSIHPTRADGNTSPTGFLHGLNVVVHEKDLVHSGCLIMAG